MQKWAWTYFTCMTMLLMTFCAKAEMQADSASPNDPKIMTYIFPGTEAPNDPRADYPLKVLRAALEITQAQYGDFNIVISEGLSESHRLHALERAGVSINVAALPAREDLNKNMVAVRVPIDFGLLGYRLLLITQNEQHLFDSVKSANDLHAFSFGTNPAWGDWQIMRDAGFTQVESNSYDGLFKMLTRGRINAFSRSAIEIVNEYTKKSHEFPYIAIEKHLLIHYQYPLYFWFSKSQEGKYLAERVGTGLYTMQRDGSLKHIFHEYFDDTLKKLDLQNRVPIELENPYLTPDDPLTDLRSWYRTN